MYQLLGPTLGPTRQMNLSPCLLQVKGQTCPDTAMELASGQSLGGEETDIE